MSNSTLDNITYANRTLENCAWNDSSDIYESQTGNVDSVKVYWALVMIPLPLMAVFGNILVILSVYKERPLQTATNYFIVSLAFADLLVAAVVMPFAVYVLVNVDWELSETLCDFYIALDVTCSTASIFNLVAISVDRFIAVTQPIKYSKHKNNRRVFLTIIFVWLVSAAIGTPIVLGLNTSPERIPNLCVFYNSDFIIYSSLSSFYIPCLVMVYLYYKIFRAIHERALKALGHRIPPVVRADHVGDVNVIENVSRMDLDENSGSQETCRKLSPVGMDDVSQTVCVTEVDDLTSHRETEFVKPCRANGSSVTGDGCCDTEKRRGCFGLGKPKHRYRRREKNAARRERKATKTLAIVLGVFLICWVPFFTCNILDAICIKLQTDKCRPGVTAFLLTTWLGYINSCVNPVIYTIFNMEFRKAFKKLLFEPCK